MAYTKFLRGFDSDGVWTKESRMIRVDENGVVREVDMDEYANEHNIDLPDAQKHKKSKKTINIDIEDKGYGDMEQTFSDGSAEEHGDGDSKSTE